MEISSIIKSILNLQKKIDVKKLPSQGLFYKDDFKISIKKADIKDINNYENNYEKDNLSLVITRVKKIVENNVILSKGYEYSDIKSIDIVFIFLEIVKFTNNKSIDIKYFNDLIGKDDIITFDIHNFNYVELDEEKLNNYDDSSKEFVINGFRYSIPCIGVENSLTKFLINKSNDDDYESYNTYSYDFLYFLGHKPFLTFSEIENLIQIFNFDMPKDDIESIKSIVKSFSHIGRYSLKKDSKVIDVTAKIDLEKIWK